MLQNIAMMFCVQEKFKYRISYLNCSGEEELCSSQHP